MPHKLCHCMSSGIYLTTVEPTKTYLPGTTARVQLSTLSLNINWQQYSDLFRTTAFRSRAFR